MKAYKFRSPSQIVFALDIVFEQRLYCADWQSLNDPMEGFFSLDYHPRTPPSLLERWLESVRAHKDRTRICSMSLTFNNHLLWVHYAAGFQGLAIEVELPKDDLSIVTINYRPQLHEQLSLRTEESHQDITRQVLSSKHMAWEYEKEVRVLQEGDQYSLRTPIKRIIAGHRMDQALFEALRIICKRKGIALSRTKFREDEVYDEPVPPLDD